MYSKTDNLSRRQRFSFASYLAIYWITGFALAFWVGLGWLMLFQAIQVLIFNFPPLYLLIIRLLLGKDVQQKEKMRLAETGNNQMISWRLILRLVFAVLFTWLFFWKINIPIIQFLRMIFR
jgi:hypothetical protein